MSRLHDTEFNELIDEQRLSKAVVIAASIMVVVLAIATAIVTYYCFW